jgi:outer membrane receptor protein involved in Fe transport
MRLTSLFFALALVCLLAIPSFAAVTGKITGHITDAANGEALVGVTVAVNGTALGAVTDVDGKYTVLNVPVGTYMIRLSAVGYASVEVSNVEVSSDLATYIDQTMTSQATELGKTISVTAERPLVVKDKTTTIEIVKKDQIRALPTRGFEQVIGIQNSVVTKNSANFTMRQRGGREQNAAGTEINLRGGRPSEVAYYVDGFSQQDPLTGVSTTNISNNAIEEVSVQAGTFSAEYGHVSSGIVNVVTSSGTDEYHGTFEAVTDNVVGDSYDQNWYSGDFGGPIPGTEKGRFFVSGERRWWADRTPASNTDRMIEEFGDAFGLTDLYEDTHRLPSNWLDGWSWQAKIDYDFTPNVKLLLSTNGSIDTWQEYRQEWLLNAAHMPKYEDKSAGYNAKLTHTLNANTFYNLSASYYMTERYRGDGVVFKDYEAHQRFHVNPEYEDLNLFLTDAETVRRTLDSVDAGGVGYFTDGEDIRSFDTDSLEWTFDSTEVIDSVTDPINWDTSYTVDTTINAVAANAPSYYTGYLHRRSSYYGLKGDITTQLSSAHTTRFGFDFQRHTLRFFQNLNATQGYAASRVNAYGYDINGEESDDAKHPINLGLWLQDRFEWDGLIISAGLRFDYFDYKTDRIINPASPRDPDESLQDTDPTNDVPEDVTLGPEDLEPSKKFYRFSPRIGVSFPVSDRTQMHINYGKSFQRPDLNKLYLSYDFLDARIGAGSFYPFASPNLEPEKTTQYEVGITHQLGLTTAFGVTAYYKDIQDLTAIFHQAAVPTSYDFYSNTDYGTVKGVDLSFTMRRTHNIAMSLKYTLSYATGTGSYPNSQYIIAWQNPSETPKQTQALDFDRRHSMVGVIDWRTGRSQGPKLGDMYPLENFGVNFLVSAGSGTPYTPFRIYDEATEAAVTPLPRGQINSSRMPWTWQIDMKAEKTIDVGSYKLVPYVWVKNLLDRDNVVGVYEGTGQADETNFLRTPEGAAAYTGSDADLYRLKQFNPTNYGNPRQILFGVRLSF